MSMFECVGHCSACSRQAAVVIVMHVSFTGARIMSCKQVLLYTGDSGLPGLGCQAWQAEVSLKIIIRWHAALRCREAAVAAQAVTELLDVLRSSPALAAPAATATAATADWIWEDAASGLAALGALHGAAADDLARVLRPTALRGGAKDAGTAAAVAASLAASPRGRAALLSEGVLPGLVGVAGNPSCSPAARAAAADTIGALAVPASVVLDNGLAGGAQEPGRARAAAGSASPTRGQSGSQQNQQHGTPAGVRVVDPKLEAVRAGAVAALVGLLRAGAGPGCVLEAAEALYVLAGCQAGRDAALAAGARNALQVRLHEGLAGLVH
jgi:hypothetical protein